MKKYIFIVGFIGLASAIISCNDDVRREPGKIYMPDMAYSRAYETYADHSFLEAEGINYNNKPVKGTIARGEEMPFLIVKDNPGDTTNYILAKQVKSPIDSLSSADLKEAERLYLVNCGICHGPKLDGNGPLYKGGDGPYPAKPATLVGDIKYESMPEGQMFYSVTYGKKFNGKLCFTIKQEAKMDGN